MNCQFGQDAVSEEMVNAGQHCFLLKTVLLLMLRQVPYIGRRTRPLRAIVFWNRRPGSYDVVAKIPVLNALSALYDEGSSTTSVEHHEYIKNA